MYNIKIEKDMFTLKFDRKSPNDLILKAPLHSLKSILKHLQFNDVDLALEIMNANGHDCANFGVRKHFISSCESQPEMYQEITH